MTKGEAIDKLCGTCQRSRLCMRNPPVRKTKTGEYVIECPMFLRKEHQMNTLAKFELAYALCNNMSD